MGKLLPLILSGLLAALLCGCQQKPVKTVVDLCGQQHYQDSLIERYINQGAKKWGYNHPNWEVYCDSLIAICPDIAYAYREKAIPYIKNGEYAKAFALEDKAVALDPKRWTAYRGFLKCIFTKDYEGAIADFQKAQQLTPNATEMDHTYPFFEGLCNLELGNYEQAEANFNHDILIQTNGDTTKSIHFNTLFYIGVLHYERKQYQQSKERFLQCLQLYKQFPDANYYLALVYEATAEKDQALEHLQIAKESLQIGYGLNEDNTPYAYYPHQITAYEVDQAMAALK